MPLIAPQQSVAPSSKLNIEELDDPPVFDVCDSFAGGQNSYQRPNRLFGDQAHLLTNMRTDQDGILVTRRGTDQLGSALASSKIQGIASLYTPSVSKLIAFCNALTFNWSGVTWSSIAGYTPFDASVPVTTSQLVDKLYIACSGKNLFKWDGTTFTDLGTGGANQPPTGGTILLDHTNRLFLSGVATIPDAVYVSDILNGDLWNVATNMFRVSAGDGDDITGMSTWLDFDLVVLKRGSIYIVGADPSVAVANWQIKRIHNLIGCISGRTVRQVGDDVFFLSNTGIRTVRRTLAARENEVGPALSYPVHDIIQRINWDYAYKSGAVFWDDKYMIALPLDNATEPSHILTYDTKVMGENGERGSWSGLWTGLNVTAAIDTQLNAQKRLRIGTTDGKVLELLDYISPSNETPTTYKDETAEIASDFITRAMTFREPRNLKKGFEVEIEFYASTAEVDIDVIFDQQIDNPYNVPTEATDLPTVGSGLPRILLSATLPFTLPPSGVYRRAFSLLRFTSFRELQFRLRTTSGKLSVRSIIVSGFVETYKLEE